MRRYGVLEEGARVVRREGEDGEWRVRVLREYGEGMRGEGSGSERVSYAGQGKEEGAI
jgi:hypothetical protein